MRLFLDDLRPCPEGYTLARTIEEAQDLIVNNKPKVISLDHDLGGADGSYEKTGYDFCKWLVERWYYEPMSYDWGRIDIYLHTSNPPGRDNMYQLLTRYAPEGVVVHRGPHPYWNVEAD